MGVMGGGLWCPLTLASYLKKTKQGRDFLHRIREQRAIPQVSNFLLQFKPILVRATADGGAEPSRGS